MPVETNHKLRFGWFELDRQSGELSKLGHKLSVHGQPIEVLSILLERPGEVVTREELCKRLWPEDTFVDFEHSLNTAIKKLRQALNDDPEKPRYIETLPKKGYRFIAGVEIAEQSTAYETRPNSGSNPPSPHWKLAVATALALAVAAGDLAMVEREPWLPGYF